MSTERLAIFVKQLLDGNGKVYSPGAIVCENGRIVAVGARKRAEPAARNAKTIDARDLCAVPGLINLHAHLAMDCGPDFMTSALLENERNATMLSAYNARQMLYAGITTVRDLGGKYGEAIAVRDAIEKGWTQGPRVLAAGKVVCMTGGHCWFIGLESDGPHEIRKSVRSNLKLGADCIKVIATGGVLSPGVEVGSAQLDLDELKVAVREAHKAGRRVAAHAIGANGIKNALEAGVDTIEHGCYLDDAALALFKKSSAYYVPTLCAPHFLYQHLDALPAYAARKTKEVYEVHRESFKKARRQGVRVAAGTDSGTPFNLHTAFVTELELMHDLGMPSEDALQTTWTNAADALGLRDCGVLEEGKSADVLLVDGDPRKDLGALRRVRTIVARGQVVAAA